MKHGLAALALATALGAFGEIPAIRFAAESPFKDGKAVEAVWAKADTCTRFIEVVNYNVARNQSEARILFDDANLYVALKGYYDKRYERGDKKSARANNFEFFIKPKGGEQLQVIVDEFERLYVGKAQLEVHDSGITAKVVKGEEKHAGSFWTAYLTIPFATLGVAAPTADETAKVGIFRCNINVHEREKLYSNRMIASGFTPNDYSYRVPDMWADMTFTRQAGKARRVEGPTFGKRINLFPDPDFNVPSRYVGMGNATYTETMAMSGEWVYRSSGKDYTVVQLGAHAFKPNTRYTLVVKARSFGAGSGLRAFQLVREANGRVHEGSCITMLTPLGPDMHEYFLPFTTAPGQSWTIVLYKVDNRADDTGVEIAAVRCYEGEISSFELRKLTRVGRGITIPGTEIPVTPNPIGRFAKKLKVLAFVRDHSGYREPEEILAGTGFELDTLLLAGGREGDIYSTYGDTKAITERIKKSQYDLVMVPWMGASKIGKEMAKTIRTCVEKGGGLYIDSQKSYGQLEALVREAKDGRLGKGRVASVKMSNYPLQYMPIAGDRQDTVSLFPADAPRMRVAATAWRTAVGEFANTQAASEKKETFVYAGKKWTFTKKLDANGGLIDWTESSEPVVGPRLCKFSDDGRVSTVSVTGDVAGVTFAWALRDFSGRVLAEGEMPAAANVKFTVPREKLYTNFGGIRLALKKGGEELDMRGEAIFVRDNDRKRLMDDYTPAMWPGNGAVGEMAQLEDIGIRSAIIASAGGSRFAGTLANGFGVGGCWLGEFQGRHQKSNVREPSFNTRHFREYKPKDVRETVRRTAEYGLLDTVLCDEPNLVSPGRADEVDAHPDNLAEYRVRMEKKYGTIAEYNRRHETEHKSFADLDQTLQADARKAKKYAEFIEWRNFNVDRWIESIRLISDNARAVDDAPFMINNSFGQSALSGNDYWKLLTRAGIGFSTEYTHMVYFGRGPICNFDEFYRSFRPDMRVWGWTGYFYSHGCARFMPWWTACHRYGGFAWYCATGVGYNIVDAPTFARTIDGDDLRQSLLDTRLLDGFGKVLTCWPWAARDVAIYYSHDAMLLSWILGTETKNNEVAAVGPLHDYMESRQGAQYTIEQLLYQHDFVAPEQVIGGRLQGKGGTADGKLQCSTSNLQPPTCCKALFVPRIIAMSDAEVAAVKAYLANGGKMMCDALPGDYDELGVKRAANPFAGLAGITVLGKNFNDLDKDCRKAVKAFLESAGATCALACGDMIGHFGREAMHYVSGNADLYAVIREGGKDDDALTYRFAKKGHVYDVQARKYLGETDTVTTKTTVSEGTALAVLPSKIETVRIDAPATAARGEELKADFAIVSDDVTAAYALHIEVVPPSGKVRFHFKRNMLTKDGKASLTFPMALNDESGAWKLCVTEPLTGVTAEKPFTVR